MRTSEPVISTEPAPGDVQYLEDRIYEFNSAKTSIADGQWLAIFVRDDDDRIVAGICGNTWGGCAEIRQFWVEETRRRQGLGTRLLRAAEQEARRRGCRQMLLMTFSFQAPAFYARHGFEVMAVVDDHPHGHTNMLMRKWLAAEASYSGTCPVTRPDARAADNGGCAPPQIPSNRSSIATQLRNGDRGDTI